MKENRNYSPELKLQAVRYYLDSDDSLIQTCKLFNISNHRSLRTWVDKFKIKNPDNQAVLIEEVENHPQSPLIKKDYYTLEFKLQVVRHYMETDDGFGLTSQLFKISGKATVAKWVTKYRDQIITSEMSKPVKKDKPVLPDNPEAMILRIRELEEALENEQLKSAAMNALINVAERDLKISIRKKSGAKQLKK